MRTYYNKDKRKFVEMSYEGKYLLDPKYMTKKDMQYYYRYYNMAKNRSQFKKIIIIVFCLCFFSYIFVDYNLRTKLIQLRDRFDFVPRMDAKYNTGQAYFVNTPGCRMPYFAVTDDNIVQFMFKPRNYTCRKALLYTNDIDSLLMLNMNAAELRERYNVTNLSQVRCNYTEIKRKSDYKNDLLTPVPFKLEYNQSVIVPQGVEYIRVECGLPDSKNFYHDYHFFAVQKKKEHANIRQANVQKVQKKMNFIKRTSVESNEVNSSIPKRVSVMVLGIDSVSHLNFLRQMPRTAAYIRSHLSHVEFWGYNKVGDNTYPNLIPLLSGLDPTELNISCLAPVKQDSYDQCAFIWKRYQEAGYRTVYAEDVASLGLFNYGGPGFKRQPTDYYLRPILLEMERHISYYHRENMQLCKGGRRTVAVLFELIQKLLPHLQTEDFFSFFWTVTITHDLLNMANLLDGDLLPLLKKLETANIFNKTVVFVLSDHGLRWGHFRETYQGMMEERQPLLMALYPYWMREQYPQAIVNMEQNAKRLVTPYDLHSTLLDLTDLRRLQDDKLAARTEDLLETIATDTMPRGISLFLPVPKTRTCENAGIASHWCTCHESRELQTNEWRVQRAARYIVQLINENLKTHLQCRTLYLNAILQALQLAPHHKIVKNITSDYSIDLTLRIQTKPGLAEFESTVRMSGDSIALSGTISRLNLYASQSYCIDQHSLKMFCYCHR